jgi:hypothetical protein
MVTPLASVLPEVPVRLTRMTAVPAFSRAEKLAPSNSIAPPSSSSSMLRMAVERAVTSWATPTGVGALRVRLIVSVPSASVS